MGKRRLPTARGLVVITESVDHGVVVHLNAVTDELRAREPDLSSSSVEAVNYLSGLTSPYDTMHGYAMEFITCSSVKLHNDDQVSLKWSHLVYLGPVDGNAEVEHVLHVLPVAPGWETMESWNSGDGLPADVMALRQQVVLRPGSVVAFENRSPHWMTWSDGDARMDDLYEVPPSDDKLVHSESVRAEILARDNPDRYVATFLSVICDHLMDVEEITKVALSTLAIPVCTTLPPR